MAEHSGYDQKVTRRGGALGFSEPGQMIRPPGWKKSPPSIKLVPAIRTGAFAPCFVYQDRTAMHQPKTMDELVDLATSLFMK